MRKRDSYLSDSIDFGSGRLTWTSAGDAHPVSLSGVSSASSFVSCVNFKAPSAAPSSVSKANLPFNYSDVGFAEAESVGSSVSTMGQGGNDTMVDNSQEYRL